MTRHFSLFALTGFALIAPGMLLAQNSDLEPSAAVMQAVDAAFLPSAGDSPSDLHRTCAAVFRRNGDGTPDLIAAAYGGNRSKVAMLSYKAGQARIIDGLNNRQFDFDGGPCESSIINLADPAQPSSSLAKTVQISFGGQDWFFLWDGERLHSITALDPRTGSAQAGILPDSYMHTTEVVDIDHGGVMQVVGNNGDSDKFPQDDGIASTGTDILFRYNGTTFVPARILLYLEEYEPNLPKSHDDWAAYKTNASPWTHEINMHQTPAPSYHLKIVNGDRDGGNRVTSAKIEINGKAIAAPGEVNQGVETLSRSVQLQKQNVIKVTVDGPAKSHIYVVVE